MPSGMWWTAGKALAAVGLAGGAVALLGVGALLLGQERLIYFPRAYGSDQLGGLESRGIRPVRFLTGEGAQEAYYVPSRSDAGKPPARLWILFGGNGSLALDWLDLLSRSADPGAGYLLVDYPGYGTCEGKPSPESILLASEKAFETLSAELGLTPAEAAARLGVLGHSLGAAAALQFAARVSPRRIVLVAPFTSTQDMARRMVGGALARFLRHRYDNAARLEELVRLTPRPAVVLFHGTADEVIPVEMGRSLAAAHPDWIDYREIPGGDHNGILHAQATAILAAMAGGG